MSASVQVPNPARPIKMGDAKELKGIGETQAAGQQAAIGRGQVIANETERGETGINLPQTMVAAAAK